VRVIKLALLSIFFLFTVVTLISLLIPSHVRISKAINIHGSTDSALALVKDTARWKQWHPAFIPSDSALKFPTVQITTQSANDSEVVMQLQQANKPVVINGWKVYEHQGADSLTLQWYMDFHIKWYPWSKFGSLFYENTYGVMMQQGLENIRNLTSK
jgi:hypothetical protein